MSSLKMGFRALQETGTKWEGLKRTYKKYKRDKRPTGRGRREWLFSEAVDNLLKNGADVTTPVAMVPLPPSSSQCLCVPGSPIDVAMEPPPAPHP